MHKDWDALRYVLAVADEGTISGAARRLGVNHATVLRRIAQFEARTGTELFDKTPRGYALPDDRRRIIEAAREVDRAVQLVGRLLEGARTPVAGEVRVTSTDSFCQVLLPAVLAGIATAAPDLRLTLISSNAYVDLGRTQADITVRPTVRLPDEFVGEYAAELGFAAYERQGGNDLWLGLTGQLERTIAARWMADNVPREATGDGADSFLTLRELAALGRGRAILPCFLGDDDARLTRIDGGIPEMSVGVWVACHADLADVPRLARTRRLLVQGLAGRARELLGAESGG